MDTNAYLLPQPPFKKPGFIRDWYVCQSCGHPYFVDRRGGGNSAVPDCCCTDLKQVTPSEAFDALAAWEAS